MKDWEYIIHTKRENIDYINKIMEAYEGVGNVRTLDNMNGVIKILTNSFFINEVDMILEKLKKYDIDINIVEKREWQGVL